MRVEVGSTLISLDTFNTPDTPPPQIGEAVEISLAERDLLVLSD
jgi:putative spermidine/putrescine transport system ATP-binding protein